MNSIMLPPKALLIDYAHITRPANKFETELVLDLNLEHLYFSNISELPDHQL